MMMMSDHGMTRLWHLSLCSEGDGVEFPMRRGEQDRQEAWSRRGRGRDLPQEDDPDSELSESEPLRRHGP